MISEGATISQPAGAPPVEPEFRALDGRVVNLWRIRHGIMTVILMGIATVIVLIAGLVTERWLWPVIGWQLLLVLRVALLVWYPRRAYGAWGYRLDGKVLETRRGIWFRTHQLLPLSRLQHVDLHSGPIERSFGLASLVLHTAGTQHASIGIPGLDAKEAARLRDELVVTGGDDGV
jgi:membrane protein YdbS with pleckstrin-like domain